MEVLAGVVKTLFCPECSNQILEQKEELIKKKKLQFLVFWFHLHVVTQSFLELSCHIVDAMRLCCLKS